jgi:poly-beta-1,6-N-acetyl-D-glucosamine synthase
MGRKLQLLELSKLLNLINAHISSAVFLILLVACFLLPSILFMQLVYLLFWLSLSVLMYTYVVYALLLLLLTGFKRKGSEHINIRATLPPITLIIAAYNEATWIDQKIQNCLSLDYPKDKLKTVFVTDGSTDKSNLIISAYKNIEVLHEKERRGKTSAVNRAMQQVQTPIVIFSDANTFLNTDSIKQIVKHYGDENVGAVAGEKKVEHAYNGSSIGLGEGLYWKYESLLKQLDYNFNTVVGAAGELFSMRTELFTPLDEDTIVDDFILSMRVSISGYKVAYEPNAFATEAPSLDLKEERKRRVRIAAGDFQSLFKLKRLLNIFLYPALSFQYISRRVFRWVLCPVCMVLLFICNAVIFHQTSAFNFYVFMFMLQSVFYLAALFGWLFYKLKLTINPLFIPFYFVFMNALLVEGFYKYITGKQTVLWDKADRK